MKTSRNCSPFVFVWKHRIRFNCVQSHISRTSDIFEWKVMLFARVILTTLKMLSTTFATSVPTPTCWNAGGVENPWCRRSLSWSILTPGRTCSWERPQKIWFSWQNFFYSCSLCNILIDPYAGLQDVCNVYSKMGKKTNLPSVFQVLSVNITWHLSQNLYLNQVRISPQKVLSQRLASVQSADGMTIVHCAA